MNKIVAVAGGAAVALLAGAYIAVAQAPAGGPPKPPPPMSFFVTSVGNGDGGNLGGLAGADAHCQQLATAVGRGGSTWHAYMSTQGPGGVNARDRIGAGPWYNAKGAMVAKDNATLHGDTLTQAQLGNALGKQFSLDEHGKVISGFGDMPNTHDMLTGTMPNGNAYADGDHTCKNWTSDADTDHAQLGHMDKQGGGNSSWNSAHNSAGCSQPALVRTGGAGLYYCFAIN